MTGRMIAGAMLGAFFVGGHATPACSASAAYSQGDLNGQNGWDGGIIGGNPVPFTNNEADSNVITNSDAFTGAQSWRYSGSYGSPGAGTPFTPDVATVGAPNAASVFGAPLDSPVTPAGDQSVVSFAFRAVAPGDGSRINIYEGSLTRDARVGANVYVETLSPTTVHLYFFELSSTDQCSNQDFPAIDVATVSADSWHTVVMTTTYPNITAGDLSTYGSTTFVVDQGTPGEVTVVGDSPWVHGFNYCNGFAYTPGGSLKFSNSFNDYPAHQGFYLDDVSMNVIDTTTLSTAGAFATSFELCDGDADCDDGNACTDDSCDQDLGCQNTNNTAPCTDGDGCTTESCSGGICVETAATDCDDQDPCTADSCESPGGCVNDFEPATTCFNADHAVFQIRNSADASKDSLKFSMTTSAHVSQAALGEPLTTTGYGLCVYDMSAVDQFEFAGGLSVPPGSQWTFAEGTVRYLDRFATFDGVREVRAGSSDLVFASTRARVKAKGSNLTLPVSTASGDPYFALEPGLVVQLLNDDGSCWSADFAADQFKRNTTVNVKARK